MKVSKLTLVPNGFTFCKHLKLLYSQNITNTGFNFTCVMVPLVLDTIFYILLTVDNIIVKQLYQLIKRSNLTLHKLLENLVQSTVSNNTFCAQYSIYTIHGHSVLCSSTEQNACSLYRLYKVNTLYKQILQMISSHQKQRYTQFEAPV